MVHKHETPPGMIIDEDPQSSRLMAMDAEIHRTPIVFIIALATLGEEATAQTRAINKAADGTIPLSPSPADMIQEYFSRRYDRIHEFDTATEQAIAETLPNATGHDSYVVHTGKIKSITVTDPNSESNRDANRRHRLETYMQRVLAYERREAQLHQATPKRHRLPNTG